MAEKTRKHFAKKVLFILLLITIGALYLAMPYLSKMHLLYLGYCLEEKRYLTDQEKCDIAAMAIVKEKDIYITHHYSRLSESGQKIWAERLVKKYDYSSLKEFYELNPNCCKFVEKFEHPDRPPFAVPCGEKISGLLNTFVSITYIFAFNEQDSSEPIELISTFGLSNCGKLWTRSELVELQQSK